MSGLDLTGLGKVAEVAGAVVDRLFPDKAQAEREQLAATLTLIQGQLDANREEAKSASLFVSGWRPFVGWVCGAGCAWNWIGLPIAKTGLAVAGLQITVAPADLSEMLPLLVALLGIGGYRTVEKIRGVAAK